jgi:hypothetical protein
MESSTRRRTRRRFSLVQVMDNFVANRRLAMIVEARMGAGRLLVWPN